MPRGDSVYGGCDDAFSQHRDMSLRHVVFSDAATLCTDPWLRDVFVAMAYGLYPVRIFFLQKKCGRMCVSEDSPNGLMFRRTVAPTERDRAARLHQAASELQAYPEVVQYNEMHPLHVVPRLWTAPCKQHRYTCTGPI